MVPDARGRGGSRGHDLERRSRVMPWRNEYRMADELTQMGLLERTGRLAVRAGKTSDPGEVFAITQEGSAILDGETQAPATPKLSCG
jgi:hypothetical protein